MSAKSRKLDNFTQSDFIFTRENLAKLRQKAVRRGCYFKCLAYGERRLFDLTIRVVDRVRSFLLAKVVSRCVRMLVEAMESRIIRLIRTEGKDLVIRLSEVASSWGHKTAKSWVKDRGFMQFLVVNNLGELTSC